VLGKEDLDGERKPKKSAGEFAGGCRRSLYIQVRRTRPLAVLETFDIASNAPNCMQRSSSNVATQALMLMNSQFVINHAEKMARGLIAAEDELPGQLEAAWKRCFGRDLDQTTLTELIGFVKRQQTVIEKMDKQLPRGEVQRRALATACQALISSNAFLYVD
jgi:hypothetical protein